MGPSLALGQLLGFLLTGHDFTNPTQERAALSRRPLLYVAGLPRCSPPSRPPSCRPLASPRPAQPGHTSHVGVRLGLGAPWGLPPPTQAYSFSHPFHSPYPFKSRPSGPTPKQGPALGGTLAEAYSP